MTNITCTTGGPLRRASTREWLEWLAKARLLASRVCWQKGGSRYQVDAVLFYPSQICGLGKCPEPVQPDRMESPHSRGPQARGRIRVPARRPCGSGSDACFSLVLRTMMSVQSKGKRSLGVAEFRSKNDALSLALLPCLTRHEVWLFQHPVSIWAFEQRETSTETETETDRSSSTNFYATHCSGGVGLINKIPVPHRGG